MTHKSSHIIIALVDNLTGLEDRLEHLSEEQLEKVLEITEKANRDLSEAVRQR